MTLKEYLEATHSTAVYPCAGENNLEEMKYLALGLAGETGESADCIKKIVRSPDEETMAKQLGKLKGELGDVFWYLVRLAHAAGFDLDEVLKFNVDKLNARKAEGKLKAR